MRKSLGALHEEEREEDDGSEANGSEVIQNEEAEEYVEPKPKRDDDSNPYWIDDEDLKKGPVDYLSGVEINFWRDIKKKYLKPLEMTKKEQNRQAQELKDYRDSFIFTFLMINSLYVVLITLLQLQSNIKIPWTVFSSFNLNGLDGLRYNFTYHQPDSLVGIPQITISRESKMLDVLGLCFLATFSSITFAQVIGMLMHRWQTCKYSYLSCQIGQ